MCINLDTFFACSKLVTLFSTSVHNVGLKGIVFLTLCRVAHPYIFPVILSFSLYWPNSFEKLPLY